MDEAKILQLIEQKLNERFGNGQFVLPTHMQFLDGRNIQTGRGTGTQIGTAADQKVGFFGAAPVAQQSHPTTLANVISLLQSLGLSA